MVSSPSFLGLSCGSGASSNRTVKDILQGDPLPDCWHEPLTEAELSAMGLENTEGPEGSHWYWERCLKGVKPDKLDVSPSNIHFTIGLSRSPTAARSSTCTDTRSTSSTSRATTSRSPRRSR